MGWREVSPNHDEEYWSQCYGKLGAYNGVQNYNKCTAHKKLAVQWKKENWNMNKDKPTQLTFQISSNGYFQAKYQQTIPITSTYGGHNACRTKYVAFV